MKIINTPLRRGHLGRRFVTVVALAASTLTIGMAANASAHDDPSCPRGAGISGVCWEK